MTNVARLIGIFEQDLQKILYEENKNNYYNRWNDANGLLN